MRKKCDQYWPTRGAETYGFITVTITATQELATYSIRTFQLSRAGQAGTREIKQIQYVGWPDHGKPSFQSHHPPLPLYPSSFNYYFSLYLQNYP